MLARHFLHVLCIPSGRRAVGNVDAANRRAGASEDRSGPIPQVAVKQEG